MTDATKEGRTRAGQSVWNVAVAVALGVLFYTSFVRGSEGDEPARDLVARSVAIVDQAGVERLRLSAKLPNPRVGGEEFPRSVAAAGIQFNDGAGNEAGGLALLEQIGGMALCFDYPTAEAVCLTKIAKTPFVGLTMLAPPSASASIGQPGPERVFLGFEGEGSSLVLSDAAGRPRARLAVGPGEEEARLELLGSDGEVRSAWPSSSGSK